MNQARRVDARDGGRPSSVEWVWYASYGSNMHTGRLRYYLSGGCPPDGARSYPGCRDARMPARSVPVELPGTVYFATESSVWTGGRAFYDAEYGGEPGAEISGDGDGHPGGHPGGDSDADDGGDVSGHPGAGLRGDGGPGAPGRVWAHAHLITAGQLADIAAQEMYQAPGRDLDLAEALATGRVRLGPGRYQTLVHPGDLDGLPLLTFTAPWRAADVAWTKPSAAYLRHLASGLREAGAWEAGAIAAYLASRPGAAGRWTAADIALLTDGLPG